MTPRFIVDRLCGPKGITAVRVQKAKNLAQRQRMPWEQVLAAMTEEQRKQVDNAQG